MKGIEVHRYEITLNGELVGTAKDLTIAELIFDKKCQQLFPKHYLTMCETVDRLKIIDVEKDAIIKQTEFN
jgi:hypothetical protein